MVLPVLVPPLPTPTGSLPFDVFPFETQTIYYTALDTLDAFNLADIFQDPPTTEVVRLAGNPCPMCLVDIKHNGDYNVTVSRVAWKDEVYLTLGHCKKCPVCDNVFGAEPQGTMPTASMKILQDRTLTCCGFDPSTLVIDYTFPSDTQRVYHTSAGATHSPADIQAFVPDCRQGRRLLKRLVYAFHHGLTFTMGTTLSTGTPNVVVMTSLMRSLVGYQISIRYRRLFCCSRRETRRSRCTSGRRLGMSPRPYYIRIIYNNLMMIMLYCNTSHENYNSPSEL
jgi:deltex-like protein